MSVASYPVPASGAAGGRVARARDLYALLSLTAFISVLILMTVGSIVRVTGNGLGCPDWPLCYGQVVPPLQLSAWVEFSHRLAGAITSIQIVALTVLAWRVHRDDLWVLAPATALLGLLILQVSLGAIHVLLELPPSSGWMHTGVAMAIVGVAASQVGATHLAARSLSDRANAVVRQDRGLPVVLGTTAAATYLLILTGSYVTRSGASLACPAFPYCGAEATAVIFPELVKIQLLHRFMAYGVALMACLTLWRLAQAARAEPALRGAALVLGLLIAGQFGLGAANVLLRLPPWSRTLHLLAAALLWTGLVLIWTILQRRPARPA